MRQPFAVLAVLLPLLLSAACANGPPAPVRDGFLDVAGGDRLYYRLLGGGPDTILFVSGGPALSSRYLEEAFGDLAAHHGLLFYDQRGMGRSPPAQQPESLSLARQVGDLEALRRHFGLSALRLVAHHWGAGVAEEYTRIHPGVVEREVLLAPIPIRAELLFPLMKLPNDSVALGRHAAARAERLDSLDPSGYCRRFWGFQFSPIEETDPWVVRRLAPAICDATPDRLRGREGLSRILAGSLGAWNWADSPAPGGAPRLVIVGRKEPLLIDAASRWTAVGDARLLAVGETTLFPWLEAGSVVRREVEAFLARGQWPEGAEVVGTPARLVTVP